MYDSSLKGEEKNDDEERRKEETDPEEREEKSQRKSEEERSDGADEAKRRQTRDNREKITTSYRIFAGGLSQRTTKESLQKYFKIKCNTSSFSLFHLPLI